FGLTRGEPGRNAVHDASWDRFAHGDARLERELEQASFSDSAVDDEVAMHQAGEIPADGKAQSGAADTDLRVRLIERVEDPWEIARLDSRSRVLDGDRDEMPVRSGPAGRGANRNPAAPGEFDGVAQQIDDHLADLAGVPRQRERQLRILFEREPEALLLGQLAEHPLDFVQQP